MSKLVTIQHAARVLGVASGSLRNWMQKLPAERKPPLVKRGHRWWCDLEEIKEWHDTHQMLDQRGKSGFSSTPKDVQALVHELASVKADNLRLTKENELLNHHFNERLSDKQELLKLAHERRGASKQRIRDRKNSPSLMDQIIANTIGVYVNEGGGVFSSPKDVLYEDFNDLEIAEGHMVACFDDRQHLLRSRTL